MNTPICDFVNNYAKKCPTRLHMPGHKGIGPLGMEKLDITEIQGADNLYDPDGIIRESEENASILFGCPTYYSTEGSSLAIRAIVFLLNLYAASKSAPFSIWAARNVHKTFLAATAMLDTEPKWITSQSNQSYISCAVDAENLNRALTESETTPVAVYLTSPDYLGNVADIRSISQVCHKHGVLLAVDNAHGAYLRFLPKSAHPIDLGADICCDSAHKTLPALTEAAYLHISPKAPELFRKMAKHALSLFGSTSPSYLILQSLDVLNPYLEENYKNDLAKLIYRLSILRTKLKNNGYKLVGNEPLKLTVATKPYGYIGHRFADILHKKNIVCEFCDPDFIVFMFSPSLTEAELAYFEQTMLEIPAQPCIENSAPDLKIPKRVMTARKALLSPCEETDTEKCVGRILASPSVSCPPAIPIVMSGEQIDEHAVNCFSYYGIKKCMVIKNS